MIKAKGALGDLSLKYLRILELHQHGIICYLAHWQQFLKMSLKSLNNFFPVPLFSQTDTCQLSHGLLGGGSERSLLVRQGLITLVQHPLPDSASIAK